MGNAAGRPEGDAGGDADLLDADTGASPASLPLPSPPPSPGSPLSYAPHAPTEPLPPPGPAPEFAGGWGGSPRTVSTVIAWAHGGTSVEVEGSWDGWRARTPLARAPGGRGGAAVVKSLPPGVYQYKFVVDGAWRYAPDQVRGGGRRGGLRRVLFFFLVADAPSSAPPPLQAAAYDESGNVNNVLEVRDPPPECLDGLASFDAPPSPPSSYGAPSPSPDDCAKDPPGAPPHLQLTLLNVPTAASDAATASGAGAAAPPCGGLPRPQHVVLNHLYARRSDGGGGAGGGSGGALASATAPGPPPSVVGTTTRFRGKYVTTVLYAPRPRVRAGGSTPPG